MNRRTSRADIFAALAQGLDLPELRERFRLSPAELQDLFREAARHYRDLEQGSWILYCDGASRGNPGPGGAGAVLLDPQGREWSRQSLYLGETTNNVAEYRALLLGLKLARRAKVARLQVFLDSELLVKQLTGLYRVKSPHLLPLWQEAKKELQNFKAHAISHVPREANSRADALANQAIDRKPPSS
jgi:ribonuclease HI